MPVLVKDRFRPDQLIKDPVDVPAKVVEPQPYGRHRRFNAAGGVLRYGGGMQHGQLPGLTAAERPCKTLARLGANWYNPAVLSREKLAEFVALP